MKIYSDLGRYKTDMMFLETHRKWGANPTLVTASNWFLKSCEDLEYYDDICDVIARFQEHGFLLDYVADFTGITETITGNDFLCNTASLYSIQNVPSENLNIVWNCSENITLLQNDYDTCYFKANGSGIGKIWVNITGYYSCQGTFTSDTLFVELDPRTPIISDTWSEDCQCTVSDPLSTNTTYDWDMLQTNNPSTNATDFVWEIWGYELPKMLLESSPASRSSWPYTAYGKHLSYIFSEEQYYTIRAKHKMCGKWSSWGEKYVTVGSGGLFLLVAPNPSTNETTVSLMESSDESAIQSGTVGSKNELIDEWELEIYSTGQILIEKRTNLRTNNVKIQTQGWEEGIYFIIAKYKGQLVMSKLIVRN
ncbi:MAG: T9SS type A sorting domain-containing protein [Bacteroidales bacterium]